MFEHQLTHILIENGTVSHIHSSLTILCLKAIKTGSRLLKRNARWPATRTCSTSAQAVERTLKIIARTPEEEPQGIHLTIDDHAGYIE
jgi:hypothetical protein